MKPTLQPPKGFRDFLPQEKRKRDYVAAKVKEIFERFGFEPLETPTLEYASLLLGKYGAEADKLVYTFTDKGGRELGLRYDQTVPTARVLAQYSQQLPKYFRRYQIQNVYRADKPQQGRFREFAQCDIDIFGSRSPLADAEILACSYFAFANVGYPTIKLKLNDRQVLFETLKPYATSAVSVLSIIQSVDKLDKNDETAVLTELSKKGLPLETAKKALTAIQKAQETTNLKQIMQAAAALGVPQESLEFSPTTARGLDYYTGMIFEVIVPEYAGGSLGGGGRYDNLIGQLGGVETPAVGIAFGFDRMVEAADQLGVIPKDTDAVKVLVTVFGEESLEKSLQVARELRQAGITTEFYPAVDKLPNQLKYADKKGIPWVVIIGEEEAKQNKVTLKNMTTGEQSTENAEAVIKRVGQSTD
jgi:histidyl-tRNA synthetase